MDGKGEIGDIFLILTLQEKLSPLKKLQTVKIIRTICFLYFIALTGFWIADSAGAGFINWPVITIAAVLLLQMIFRIKFVDLVLSILLTILSFYMLMAVTSDLVDHFNGTKPVVKTFAMYFGFGYGLFGTALVAALTIMYLYYYRRRLLENKEALS